MESTVSFFQTNDYADKQMTREQFAELVKCRYIRLPPHLQRNEEKLDISFLKDVQIKEKTNQSEDNLEEEVKEILKNLWTKESEEEESAENININPENETLTLDTHTNSEESQPLITEVGMSKRRESLQQNEPIINEKQADTNTQEFTINETQSEKPKVVIEKRTKKDSISNSLDSRKQKQNLHANVIQSPSLRRANPDSTTVQLHPKNRQRRHTTSEVPRTRYRKVEREISIAAMNAKVDLKAVVQDIKAKRDTQLKQAENIPRNNRVASNWNRVLNLIRDGWFKSSNTRENKEVLEKIKGKRGFGERLLPLIEESPKMKRSQRNSPNPKLLTYNKSGVSSSRFSTPSLVPARRRDSSQNNNTAASNLGNQHQQLPPLEQKYRKQKISLL